MERRASASTVHRSYKTTLKGFVGEEALQQSVGCDGLELGHHVACNNTVPADGVLAFNASYYIRCRERRLTLRGFRRFALRSAPRTACYVMRLSPLRRLGEHLASSAASPRRLPRPGKACQRPQNEEPHVPHWLGGGKGCGGEGCGCRGGGGGYGPAPLTVMKVKLWFGLAS